MSKSIPMLLRDIDARNCALRMYALAHDKFAETEQLQRHMGNEPDAEEAHQFGLIALRAWLAEKDDPEPKT